MCVVPEGHGARGRAGWNAGEGERAAGDVGGGVGVRGFRVTPCRLLAIQRGLETGRIGDLVRVGIRREGAWNICKVVVAGNAATGWRLRHPRGAGPCDDLAARRTGLREFGKRVGVGRRRKCGGLVG